MYEIRHTYAIAVYWPLLKFIILQLKNKLSSHNIHTSRKTCLNNHFILYCLDGMSAREASGDFGIPQSTIRDKINGRSEAKVLNHGNKQPISPEIEDR